MFCGTMPCKLRTQRSSKNEVQIYTMLHIIDCESCLLSIAREFALKMDVPEDK